jgi:two-component system NtrC family response regulator
MTQVLIIDDDKNICKMLSKMVKQLGYESDFEVTLQDGLQAALKNPYEIVFVDVMLPDGIGLDILPRIKETSPSPEVIIITGEGDPEGAEFAIKNGAWDYIQKPFLPNEISLSLKRVFQYREGLAQTKKQTTVALNRCGIIGSSREMKRCFDLLAGAANSEANVLITGETGTGKELFAKAIFQNSTRADQNFVVVDCASLPENLIESALFGFQKGAFTGADRSREGLIKQADGGTLFLDEVGELSISLQKAFLRVLQERCFRPIGSRKEVKSNFRLIAATNRNLDQMVGKGSFRKDLFYRLRSLFIEIPPLRRHPEDIKELVGHYLNQICEDYAIETKGISSDFLNILCSYEWPGNIRELINTVERAVIDARYESILFPKHLPPNIRISVARASVTPEQSGKIKNRHEPVDLKNSIPKLQDVREAALITAEKKYLTNLLAQTKGNIKEACRIAGLSRSRLYHLLKKYSINRS